MFVNVFQCLFYVFQCFPMFFPLVAMSPNVRHGASPIRHILSFYHQDLRIFEISWDDDDLIILSPRCPIFDSFPDDDGEASISRPGQSFRSSKYSIHLKTIVVGRINIQKIKRKIIISQHAKMAQITDHLFGLFVFLYFSISVFLCSAFLVVV